MKLNLNLCFELSSKLVENKSQTYPKRKQIIFLKFKIVSQLEPVVLPFFLLIEGEALTQLAMFQQTKDEKSSIFYVENLFKSFQYRLIKELNLMEISYLICFTFYVLGLAFHS